MTESTDSKPQDSWAGVGYALTAYLMWGFLPVYMKQLAHISPVEVIAHRVIWSVPIALVVLALTRQLAAFGQIWRQPSMLAMGAVTAGLISINWGLYIWAIGSGHALQAALGYYINPLFSIFLGAVLLRERLAPLQWAAIGLAAVGVAVMAWQTGAVPWVALGLTVTWGFYAYLKRSLPIGANQGFMLEVTILLVPSLAWLAWLQVTGTGHFVMGNGWDTGLLMIAGVFTAAPLMIYANGAKRLRLSTIAIMQYIAPTMIFVTATLVFDEPLGVPQMVAFGFIWAALILYTTVLVRGMRRQGG